MGWGLLLGAFYLVVGLLGLASGGFVGWVAAIWAGWKLLNMVGVMCRSIAEWARDTIGVPER